MNHPSDSEQPHAVHPPAREADSEYLLRDRLVEGALWVTFLRWGAVLFTWPISIGLARLLTPEDFGFLAIVGVFTAFLTLVAAGGLPRVIVLGEALSEEKYRRLHGLSISFFVTAFVVLLAVATPIERAYKVPGLRGVIFALSGILILQGLTLVPVARMRRDLRLRELPVFAAVAIVTRGIVSLAGAFAGLSYWALVLGALSDRLAYTILVLRAYALPPALPRLEGLQKTLRDAGNLLVAGMSTFVAESSDAWIGARTVGASGLGGYRFMIGLPNAPYDKISGILIYVAGPALGNIREDLGRLRAAVVRLVRLTATMMFPICVGIALVGADLVEGLLGEKWMPFVAALQVYCFFSLFRPIKAVLDLGAVAAGASRVIAGTGLILMIILPPSFFLLGDRFGATGLAMAWLLPVPLVIARLVHALRERIGFGWVHLWDALFQPFLNAAFMAMGVMALEYVPFVASAHPLGRLMILSGAGAFLYVALVFRFQKKDIQWGLDMAGSRVPARLRRSLERWI